MAVYILHFSEKYHHARHYIGFSADPAARLERHIVKTEQPLIRAVVQAGIEIKIARVWPEADKKFERRLKNQKNASRFCPVCQRRDKVSA